MIFQKVCFIQSPLIMKKTSLSVSPVQKEGEFRPLEGAPYAGGPAGAGFNPSPEPPSTTPPLSVSVEPTPNPQSLKFSLNRSISDENWETTDIARASRSPLAVKILGFPWARGVFIGPNFITLTKEEWVEWDVLKDPLIRLIKEHIESHTPVLLDRPPAEEEDSNGGDYSLQSKKPDLPAGGGESTYSSVEQGVVTKVKELLTKNIQPAVARDGGFISFASYKEGVVFFKDAGGLCRLPVCHFNPQTGDRNPPEVSHS